MNIIIEANSLFGGGIQVDITCDDWKTSQQLHIDHLKTKSIFSHLWESMGSRIEHQLHLAPNKEAESQVEDLKAILADREETIAGLEDEIAALEEQIKGL